jgi:uncharacterized protein YsxB (DUF464 family)
LICVSLRLGGEGCLRGLTAEGHSFLRGADFSPACAAVSSLLGTAAALFGAESSLSSRISLPSEGKMEMDIGEVPAVLLERCRGITDFLVCGLARVCAQAPEEIKLEVLQ